MEPSPPPINTDPPDGVDKEYNRVTSFTRHLTAPLPTSSSKGAPGGLDSTPIPPAPPGFTLKFTFHRAENLPLGDFSTMSSDPYISAILNVDLPRRHNKEDPDITFRTPTVRKSVNPEWNSQWIVANVPASGFQLKCRLYDEDSADSDDRLGNAYIDSGWISEPWDGIKEKPFKVRKRMGSQRAYLLRYIAAGLSRKISVNGRVWVSVECLGKSPGFEGGRMYTVGPNYWTKHFSPMIGRLAGTKDSVQGKDGRPPVTRYNFQAIQMQLSGPVPTELYHRYVEYRPVVAGIFNGKSLRGRLLNHALHHQHSRIYAYDRFTVYGEFPEPSIDFTKQFLEFVDYGQEGRIFTYILTLDGQWRFTETGKEFGIDLLSKHTMHSDVSIYVAYAGEFFIRCIRPSRHHRRHPSDSPRSPRSPTSPTTSFASGSNHGDTHRHHRHSHHSDMSITSIDPSHYELVVDNESGTYCPSGNLLPLLQEFLSKNLPGLKVTTLDGQAESTLLERSKEEQRDLKKATGKHITYLQRSYSSSSSLSSISSSDEEALDERSREQQQANAQQRKWMAERMRRVKDPKRTYKKWLETGNFSESVNTKNDSDSRPATS